jgi:hypothetical protein
MSGIPLKGLPEGANPPRLLAWVMTEANPPRDASLELVARLIEFATILIEGGTRAHRESHAQACLRNARHVCEAAAELLDGMAPGTGGATELAREVGKLGERLTEIGRLASPARFELALPP